jgi:peptidoglycan/xylan/chitin deacetylase (PgdA/CDA1 family)
MKPKAILTFDLEYWYNSKFLKKSASRIDVDNTQDYVLETTLPLLDLLKKYGAKATFFVLGKLAKNYPSLIKRIQNHGHEIASHGYSHKALTDINQEEFEKELKLTNNILNTITGKTPAGFRAPAFSINKQTIWALNVLRKQNFKYDSSIHPLSFHGTKNQNQILRTPAATGSIYFRALPLGVFLWYFKIASRRKMPMLYFHPYELFASAPRIKTGPLWKRKIKYIGTNNALRKFKKLLLKFKFISLEEYLSHENPTYQSSI